MIFMSNENNCIITFNKLNYIKICLTENYFMKLYSVTITRENYSFDSLFTHETDYHNTNMNKSRHI